MLPSDSQMAPSTGSKTRKWEKLWTALCRIVLNTHVRLGSVLLLAVLIGSGVSYIVLLHSGTLKDKENMNSRCFLEHELRINCLPSLPNEDQTVEVCEKANCCWEVYGHTVPNCYYSYPNDYKYFVRNGTGSDTSKGYKLQISPSFNMTPQETKVESSVEVSVEYWTPNHLRILLTASDEFDSYQHLKYPKLERRNETGPLYEVHPLSQNGNFLIRVTRSRQSSSRKSIFNTGYGPLIVSRGHTEITTLLPSSNLYGIGQSPKHTFRHDLKFQSKFSMFSRMNFLENASEAFTLSAGVHPFYMVVEEDGLSHGVLLVSTLPVEITVSGAPAVTFRTGDTRMDFHFFFGPTPAEVIQQLTEFVGRPAMPPYWALGYHSCRDTEDLEAAAKYISHTRSQRIPHESDCGTVRAFDNSSVMELDDFIQNLTSTYRKFLIFQGPHDDMSFPLEDEVKEDNESLFIRNSAKEIFEGNLPNGQKVRYPDFFSSMKVNKWLQKKFRLLNVTFDGLFLTGNTPLNFNVSDTLNCSCCEMDRQDQLLQISNSLAKGTVCMGAIHSDERQHIYYHNTYGYAHTIAVRKVLHDLSEERTFLTSLSTFIGSGAYGGHWGGEIESTWNNLKQTILQTLDFSMFGIPLTGIPVCGSHGSFDQDMCSAWIQVSAFQPLMFTYRIDGQEPLLRMTSVGRRIIQLRYSLLPYLYSLFHNATKLGHTVVRPLVFEFPKIRETYKIDEQFMWGSALMVSPNLKPFSVQKLSVYFPPECWYDFFSGKKESDSKKGSYRSLNVIKNHINLHIRGGHIIPTQPSGLSTDESRNNSYVLTIALNCLPNRVVPDGKTLAYGELFIDDGHSRESENFLLVAVTMRGKNITIQSIQNASDPGKLYETLAKFSMNLKDVRVYGLPQKPISVLVNGKKFTGFAYNNILETFMIGNLNLDLRYNHTISW